jgi:hypothetical protein
MLPSLGLVCDFGVLSAVEPCSTSLPAPPFISTFFTTERLTSFPTHFYQKDERALPGDLHSRKLSSYPPLLNVVSYTTTHFLFSLSLFSVSKGSFSYLDDICDYYRRKMQLCKSETRLRIL